LLSVAALAAAILTAPAFAAEAARVGYVDLRKVMLESKIGKKNRAEIEKLVAQRKEQLGKEEQKLKALQEAYEKDQLILTEEQKKARHKEFQDRAQAYQKLRAEAEQEVSKKDAEFSQKAVGEVREILAEIARERKLMMVFEKNQQPLYVEPGPDLTDAVMQKYDARAK
jgi:outer membrane protein